MLPAITRSLPQSIGRICQARAWLCSTSGPSAVPAWSRGTRPTLIPNQLVLIRHGESTGNVDDHVYEHTPDWRVPLTTRGQEQAHASGLGLYYKLHPDGALHVYVSPYERTWQTWEHLWRGVVEAAGQAGTAVPRIAHIREDPRLAELSFGNFQVQQVVAQAKQERNQFGRFFYRMPSGESGLEVYERMGSLTGTLFRDHGTGSSSSPQDTILLVTHGLALRMFLMRFFQWRVREFECTRNPDNCALVVMRRPGEEPAHQAAFRDRFGRTDAAGTLTAARPYRLAEDAGILRQVPVEEQAAMRGDAFPHAAERDTP